MTDLSGESEITRKLYGMDDSKTENFGQMCLLARRFADGVFVSFRSAMPTAFHSITSNGINIPTWKKVIQLMFDKSTSQSRD